VGRTPVTPKKEGGPNTSKRREDQVLSSNERPRVVKRLNIKGQREVGSLGDRTVLRKEQGRDIGGIKGVLGWDWGEDIRSLWKQKRHKKTRDKQQRAAEE